MSDKSKTVASDVTLEELIDELQSVLDEHPELAGSHVLNRDGDWISVTVHEDGDGEATSVVIG